MLLREPAGLLWQQLCEVFTFLSTVNTGKDILVKCLCCETGATITTTTRGVRAAHWRRVFFYRFDFGCFQVYRLKGGIIFPRLSSLSVLKGLHAFNFIIVE